MQGLWEPGPTLGSGCLSARLFSGTPPCGGCWSKHRALGSQPGGLGLSSSTWSLSVQHGAEVAPSLLQGSQQGWLEWGV